MGYVKEMKEEDFGWVVGKPINGITLNPLEYLMGDKGKERAFPSKEEAVGFLKDHGVSSEEIDSMRFFAHTQCLNCGEELYVPDDELSEDELGLHTIHKKCGSSLDVL